METSLYNHLCRYHAENRISFAMPGHKNGRGLNKNLLDCDVTELQRTEDLHSPSKIIKASQRLISDTYNVEHSYILTGGSTAGIQSAIAGTAQKDKILLASPDCHISVINTCAVMGIKMMLAPMIYDRYNHCIGFDNDKLKEILSKSSVFAIITVSPDYYGVCKSLSETLKICRDNNIPLILDAAHGAHFIMSDKLPKTEKADCIVMSAHKTLNALTGAAFLHINGNTVDRHRICRALGMFQTSSPSYVIASSAELSVMTADKDAWEHTISKCNELKNKLKMPFLPNDDITRLVIFTGNTTGFEVEKTLADKYNIDIEMADSDCIVLIATPSNTDSDFERLYEALKPFEHNNIKIRNIRPITDKVFCPSDGFLNPSQNVCIDNSESAVSASTVTAYPPGIPIIYSGAVITRDMIDAVKSLKNDGAKITGMENDIIRIMI